jgi:hypothetical protein
MSVCSYSVFVLPCVQVAALRRADSRFKESYRLCKNQETEKSGQGRTKDCRAIDRQSLVCVSFISILVTSPV